MEAEAVSSNSIVEALNWAVSVFQGTIGTGIAVITIAAIGFMMLRGRLPIARCAAVVLGCFILFSSQSIARGILTILGSTPASVAAVSPDLPLAYLPPTPPPVPYDPYAGASVPVTPPNSAGQLLPQ